MALGEIKRSRKNVMRGPSSNFYDGTAKQVTVRVYVRRVKKSGGYAAMACTRARGGDRCGTVEGGSSPTEAVNGALRAFTSSRRKRRK